MAIAMQDMTIRLREKDKKPLYEQIYEHIRNEIREGRLPEGEKLPSTRSLAGYLQVSRCTAEQAYFQLLSEGYIESKPYKGYYVCRVEELFRLEKKALRPAAWAVSGVPAVSGDPRFFYDFHPNGMDMNAFPYSVWKKIVKNILNGSDTELFSQGHPQGDLELRATISRYLHASRGVNCDPEQILVGAGNDYLLLLLGKMLGHGVRVAMENPTYKKAYQIFRSFGYPVTAVEMDENGMRVSRLEEAFRGEEAIQAVYVMPSRQYPTGIVMPMGRRGEILRWAEGAGNRYLIEDDYDSEFRYHGKPIPSLQALDRQGKVIFMGTFSKAIAPAIRVGYMVLPEKLLRKYREEYSFYSATVSRIDQKILNEFIRDGYFERQLNKMRRTYREKHDELLGRLAVFRDSFVLSGENAGLHLLLTGKERRTEEELIRSAARNCVKVYGISESLISGQKEPQNTILLGYGSLSLEQIGEGVERLKKAWL
ncbi:MAG: PLP-dependent aminotransferase family protein [Clostridium sp.]|jgi:GntR family transcriptional regulator/MocR family aminotransferase|nr:PLP-dependent aminotransferase family protein [Clostridium sp.]